MEKFIVRGGKKLRGEVKVSGSKNVALKALVAACLTSKKVTIKNVPLITDFFTMVDIIKELGGQVQLRGHKVVISMEKFSKNSVSLDKAASVRASIMFVAPLLARVGQATVPNPGGCRIGARPVDRIVDGMRRLGVSLRYDSSDGYFHAKTRRLTGATYRFKKNTHTGTETLILASVLAQGRTVLENVAQEPEVDELIALLTLMGAHIKRVAPRVITIDGVERLHGASYTIGPDRNEIVTFAIAGMLTDGEVTILDARKKELAAFLAALKDAQAGVEEQQGGLRFFAKGPLRATNVVTTYYPGFMTDWQGPWAVLMTKAQGSSTIHETVYEHRFGYVSELHRLGAHIDLYTPTVGNAKAFYSFNLSDDRSDYKHAARIHGPTPLHNAVVTIADLRAGATLVLATLAAQGESVVFGVEHLDRGYERFDERLRRLGADIKRIKE